MTMGEGGAVYTNDPLLHKIVNSFRDWGRDCRCMGGVDNTCRYRFSKQYGELAVGYDHKYVYSHFSYNLKLYNNGDKEQRIQVVLNRYWDILDGLPASLLKVRLLIYCYGEVFDEELARKAHSIIDSWSDREFTEEEKEIVGLLGDIEENPYPNSEVE